MGSGYVIIMNLTVNKFLVQTPVAMLMKFIPEHRRPPYRDHGLQLWRRISSGGPTLGGTPNRVLSNWYGQIRSRVRFSFITLPLILSDFLKVTKIIRACWDSISANNPLERGSGRPGLRQLKNCSGWGRCPPFPGKINALHCIPFRYTDWNPRPPSLQVPIVQRSYLKTRKPYDVYFPGSEDAVRFPIS